ncbi:uncharacterized protein PGTG_09889 [Puccinia graminis f. sp. tritici CRL 75-36-700-3]|uniref:Uncharacterized protein n=1 Tax=Puccinia graminis f. sp. tritici (strain CRL 75-36-700-3 / race SCCL) TaxID=418459 RepID=E3KF94_PUCGT|nr:uncharacterized protein PGTG_09889 [Puccinia graminis f. sp. tritici CRL 75-36-700-3]EFP82921.2 hypothetical protein PGTG_09889 [Puccinia graminis f. sp. tritici CRL 75-36-700-3]
MPPSHWKPPWFFFDPLDTFASALVSSINTGFAVFPIFPHQPTFPASFLNFHYNLQYFLHIVSQAVLRLLRTITAMSSEKSTMSSPVEIPAPRGYQAISNPTPANDTPRTADIPVHPMVGPDANPVNQPADTQVDPMADQDTEMKATVLDNAPDLSRPPPITAFPAPIPLPYGMELIQTGTHFLPQKEKWQCHYDPARSFDLSTIPDEVPVPRGFADPHPFCDMPVCCDPVFQNPPPGLVLPSTFNPLVATNLQSHAPGAHPASASSSASDVSTYPPLSEFLHLDHQSVQGLLSKKNSPPEATCLYTEEDVMRIFEGIAPEFVWLCDDFPPHTLNEFDRRVMFFENMQWHFKCKKSTYLSTRNF